VARQRRPSQVIEGFSMGERRLLNGMRRAVLASLSFADSNGVRYFDRVWLRKAVDVVERRRGMQTKVGRDLLWQVSSFMLAVVDQPPYLLYT
jgi:hypothetical protein